MSMADKASVNRPRGAGVSRGVAELLRDRLGAQRVVANDERAEIVDRALERAR